LERFTRGKEKGTACGHSLWVYCVWLAANNMASRLVL
jgi:hypothetical protein